MRKNKRRSSILIFIGLIFIAAAVALAVYNIWDDYRAASSAEKVLADYKKLRDEQIDESRGAASSESQAVTLPGAVDSSIPDYVLDPHMAMPTITVDGFKYIGTVTIPALELELPVMEQWDYVRMKTAPCRYSGSVYLDDMVICAHNYGSHFGSLGKLQINDEVIFTDAAGNVFRYSVADIKTLSGTAVKDMTSGDWDLTLFTCNYSGFARVTVRCRRIV